MGKNQKIINCYSNILKKYNFKKFNDQIVNNIYLPKSKNGGMINNEMRIKNGREI